MVKFCTTTCSPEDLLPTYIDLINLRNLPVETTGYKKQTIKINRIWKNYGPCAFIEKALFHLFNIKPKLKSYTIDYIVTVSNK